MRERSVRSLLGLALGAFALFSSGVVVGALAHKHGLHRRLRLPSTAEPSPSADLWPRFYKIPAAAAVSGEVGAQLEALGYASGYEPARSGDGSALRLEGAYEGWNLHTSGHAPEARLLDMGGRILHRWVYSDPLVASDLADRQWWRRARLGPNGELYAIRDWATLFKLSADSELLWRYDGGCHHDLDLQPDGRVFVLGSELRAFEPLGGREVVDDTVVELDPSGRMLRRVSVLDAIARSSWSALLERVPDGSDVLHTNRIVVLDGTHADRVPAFAAGRVLVSIRQLDTLAVIDLESQRVVWALTGPWHRQHDPSVLADGRLLIFDNLGNGGRAKVIEYDPSSQEIAWQYPADEQSPLESPVMGSAQRLPNGNTLIVESTAGRAFEVAPDGRLLWDFRNPERAGERAEFIATIPDLVRLPSDAPLEWLERRAP